MRKPMILSFLVMFLVSVPTVAAPKRPVAPPPAKTEAEQIDASLTELEAFIRDSSMNPRKGADGATLEDFKEDLQISTNNSDPAPETRPQ